MGTATLKIAFTGSWRPYTDMATTKPTMTASTSWPGWMKTRPRRRGMSPRVREWESSRNSNLMAILSEAANPAATSSHGNVLLAAVAGM